MQAVEKRLAFHNFVQSFQLAEDPRQQDKRTTWVEYLNFVYWWLDRHAAFMKASEPQYRKAWEELQSFDKSSYSTTITGTLDQQMKATRQEISKFLRRTNAYRRAETAVRLQEFRAQWVLEQVPLIETGASREGETAKSDSNANGSKKRKRKGDQNTETRHQPRRRRHEVDRDGSKLKPDPATRNGSDTVMPDERAATPDVVGSEPRRSQRRGVGDATAEAPLLNPQAGARRTRHRLRATRTREASLDPTLSQASGLRRREFRKKNHK